MRPWWKVKCRWNIFLVSGLWLTDGLTKQLSGGPLQRFVTALKLVQDRKPVIQLSSMKISGGDRAMVKRPQDSLSLWVVGSTLMMTPVEASEGLTTEDADGGFGMFLTILVIVVLIIGDLITRFGIPMLRSWIYTGEELQGETLG